ncbi:MAG: hypothetical protein EXS10_06260 [Phycisphaerales bacterium]|nr:hypothetical protein [Phycisphaerales bacterium]
MQDEPTIDDAIAFLRANLCGTIRFESDFLPIKVVVDQDGKLIASVMVAMLQSFDTSLYLPDENDSGLHLGVSLEEIQYKGDDARCCDRWQIYHGEPPDVRWARISIDAARFAGVFFDGDALMTGNPLASCANSVLREMNANKPALRRFCAEGASMEIEDPVLVGIDPYGFDIRRVFDIIRIESEDLLESEADVREELRRRGFSISDR